MTVVYHRGQPKFDDALRPPSARKGWSTMRTLTLEVHEDLLTILRETNPNDNSERAALEAIVLELYRRRNISSGKAAELLGMKRVDFIAYSGELGIPFFDYSAEQWQAEIRASDEWSARLRARQSSPTPAH